MNKEKKKIILGITGGIAAYKAAYLCRLLVKNQFDVHVVMTSAAENFVTSLTFQALSSHPVHSSLWQDEAWPNAMSHIGLSRQSQAILVAPATADFISQLANGQARDLLSNLCLARNCPLLIAPSMNQQMWHNSATQRNVQQLIHDGIIVLGPDTGVQACGEIGSGRMLEPEYLYEYLIRSFHQKLLQGKRVLLTAGPTFEAIDPVRGITNISSGKMGYALAQACARHGANVTLISGPTALNCPVDVQLIPVRSAQQMQEHVLAQVTACDIFIGVAAVADYRPKTYSNEKIKKSGDEPCLELVRTDDILAKVARLPNRPFCVGFAAESQQLDQYAEKKLINKQLDMVIGNFVHDAMGSDTNCITVYTKNGQFPCPKANKDQVAEQIIQHMVQLF